MKGLLQGLYLAIVEDNRCITVKISLTFPFVPTGRQRFVLITCKGEDEVPLPLFLIKRRQGSRRSDG